MGIEPTSEAWEASILPLYDARSAPLNLLIIHKQATASTFRPFSTPLGGLVSWKYALGFPQVSRLMQNSEISGHYEISDAPSPSVAPVTWNRLVFQENQSS
jgi:hypothetical protein